MRSQRKNSLDVQLLAPHWFLSSILLAVAVLVLPVLSLDTLLCYYCPLQHKSDSCTNTTSHCLPDQRCSSSTGRYGSVHILSAQGCVDADLCGSHEIDSYWGVEYNISHTCCCEDKCNAPSPSDASPKMLLGTTTGQTNHSNITGVLPNEPWDSCANYTSSWNSTLSATAS